MSVACCEANVPRVAKRDAKERELQIRVIWRRDAEIDEHRRCSEQCLLTSSTKSKTRLLARPACATEPHSESFSCVLLPSQSSMVSCESNKRSINVSQRMAEQTVSKGGSGERL